MAKMQKAIVYKGPGHFAYEDRPIPEIQNKKRCQDQELWHAPSAAAISIFFAVPQRQSMRTGYHFRS